MRKRLIWLAASASLVLGAWVIFSLAKHVTLAHAAADTAAQPFVIQMYEKTVSGTAPNQHTRDRNFFTAVRSDGSRSYGNFVIAADGSWKVLARRMNLVPQRQLLQVVDKLRLKSTFRMSDAGTEHVIAAAHPSSCPMPRPYEFTGEGTFLGYRVLKFDLHLHDPGEGEQAESRWVAPNLACNTVWAQLIIKNADGTLKADTTQEAVYIYKGAPPVELFAVDPGYVEVPPSELVIRGLTPPSGVAPALDPALQERLKTFDSRYKELHPDAAR